MSRLVPSFLPMTARHTASTRNTAPEPRQFVSREVAAQRWDVSVFTIRRMIADGHITGYRLPGGRHIRVDLAEVDAAFRPMPNAKTTA